MVTLGERRGCFRLSQSFKASHRPSPLQNLVALQTLWYPEENPGQLLGFVFHNILFLHKGASRQVRFLCKPEQKGTAQLHLWPYSKTTNSYRWFGQPHSRLHVSIGTHWNFCQRGEDDIRHQGAATVLGKPPACTIILQQPRNNISQTIWWDWLAISPRDNTQLVAVIPNMGCKARQQHCRHNDVPISSGWQEQALSELSNVWGDLPARCTMSRRRTHLNIQAVIQQHGKVAQKQQHTPRYTEPTLTEIPRAWINLMLGLNNCSWPTSNYAEDGDVSGYFGWDHFMMGMVSKQIAEIQSAHLLHSNSPRLASSWILGLITQLLQVTHAQWIYRCVLVHDRNTGTLISAHKEDLLKEIEHQLVLGPNGLTEEDKVLLKCNLMS